MTSPRRPRSQPAQVRVSPVLNTPINRRKLAQAVLLLIQLLEDTQTNDKQTAAQSAPATPADTALLSNGADGAVI